MEGILWSEDEQRKLESALKQFPADKFSPLGRYVKISAYFPNKTARDVALRTKWVAKRDEKKKKKHDTHKKKSQKDRDNSAFAQGRGDGGGSTFNPVAEILEQNLLVIKQIQANMIQNRVHENTDLLAKFRDNIFQAHFLMNGMQGIMKQMPPLPAQINTQLANSFLPQLNSK